MNREEYKEEFMKLSNEFRIVRRSYIDKFKKLSKEYIESNKKINIGDIVEGSVVRVKVDNISYCFNESSLIQNVEDCCRYEGVQLVKSTNKPYKNKARNFVFGSNPIKLIKKGE